MFSILHSTGIMSYEDVMEIDKASWWMMLKVVIRRLVHASQTCHKHQYPQISFKKTAHYIGGSFGVSTSSQIDHTLQLFTLLGTVFMFWKVSTSEGFDRSCFTINLNAGFMLELHVHHHSENSQNLDMAPTSYTWLTHVTQMTHLSDLWLTP